ncbi:hypothetical protein [Psychrobacillus sp. L4]|uniref:hypothetical protein n=1 Tax=Psychrobacillus sp. L4 TaxID=3236892 RepID=UPI0036F28E40
MKDTNRAIQFEKLGKSRTFFIYHDEDAAAGFEILGYYSLAIRVFNIPTDVSNRQRLKLDGLYAKKDNEVITEVPSILIGQFGKNDTYADIFAGFELMNYCLSTIFDGQEKLGGRLLTLECKDVPSLIKFYGQFAFSKLTGNSVGANGLIQMIRILQEHELVKSPAPDSIDLFL